MSTYQLTTALFALAASRALAARLMLGTHLTRSSTSCPATCHGWTCDDWVNNDAGNTCQDLRDIYGCDCSGCKSCTGYVQGGTQEYPQDADQYPQYPRNYDSAGHAAYTGDGDEEDGRPPIVDPTSNYWSGGSGYCVDVDGLSVDSFRIPGITPRQCAFSCNQKPDCLAYTPDELGCRQYVMPVAQGNGEEDGDGCFIKGTYQEQQPSGQTHEVEMQPEVDPAQGKIEDQNDQEVHPGDSVDALNGTAALDATRSPSAIDAHISYKPLGAVNASWAQVFLWVEKQHTFFLKQRFQPAAYCVDSHEQCQQWAAEGYCTVPENTEWMMATCRLSCSACPPAIEAPANSIVAKFNKRFFSLHGTTDVTLLGKEYLLQKPHMVSVQTTWRVTLPDDTILFSFQKGECKRRKDGGCDAEWKIFHGRTHQKQLLYYGIQRTSTFKFYKSEADYEHNPLQDWRAEVRKLLPSKKEPASLKVTVMPTEDAGLILLAAHVIDSLEDLVRDQGTSDTEDQ